MLAAAICACGKAQSSQANPAQSVTVTPQQIALQSGDSRQFQAAGGPAVMWSADAGTIDQTGLYTAPGPAGTYHVTARSRADPARSATATVTVGAPTVQLASHRYSVIAGGTQQLSVQVAGAKDTRVTWLVSEGSDGGSVDAAGAYTAPAAPGLFHVVATSVADPRQEDVAEVNVTLPSGISVTIEPDTLALGAGQSIHLHATVTGSKNHNQEVIWTADGGTVKRNGFYTAPLADGVYHVTAQSVADPTRVAIAAVTVATPGTQAVEPSAVTVPTQGLVSFKANLPGTPDGQVSWSVAEGEGGGTIDALGQYQAPAGHEGVYHVVATSLVDPKLGGAATVTVRFFDLIDRGGDVAPATRTFALFWGDAAAFPADAQTAVTTLLKGIDGAPYFAAVDQYLRGGRATTTFAGILTDPAPAPTSDPEQSAVAGEACRALDAAQIAPQPGDVVFVFGASFPAEKVDYCSWHSWGVCHGQSILVAWLPNPSGTPCGQLTDECAGLSPASAALGVYTAHELVEATVNPFDGAWRDARGEEVTDKCEGLETCIPLNGATLKLTPLYSNAVHACVLQ